MKKMFLIASCVLFSVCFQSWAATYNGRARSLQMTTVGGKDYCIVEVRNGSGGGSLLFAFEIAGTSKQDYMVAAILEDINRGGAILGNLGLEDNGTITIGSTTYNQLSIETKITSHEKG